MTTARLHLNTSGTVCVNKDFFHFAFFFLDIVSVNGIFSDAKGVVNVFGEGYVCCGFVWFFVMLGLCGNAEVLSLFGL